jgi:hypothetical protein
LRKLGREIKLARVPEMLYQWDEPFVIGDRRFRERFRQEPADVDEAATATVAWAQQHYATTRSSVSAEQV